MKKLFLLLLFFVTSTVSAQVGYVDYNHPVYKFLERMDRINIISNYDEFQIPKTRKEIAQYISTTLHQKTKLNSTDKNILNDLLVEFEIDIKGTLENSNSFFPEMEFAKLFSEQEKNVFHYSDSNKFKFFVNFEGSVNQLYENIKDNKSLSSTMFKFGGTVRGSFADKFGFSIRANNGTFMGDRELILKQPNLRYNFKVTKTYQDDLGSEYFDETEGYVYADFDFLKIKFGSDRNLIGYGPNKIIMSENAPRSDYLSMNIKYKFLSFQYMHAKLLGDEKVGGDSLQGTIRDIEEKYLAYHRLGIDFGKYFKLGLGEMLIYSRRGLDFAYINPFNFYKSSEHLNQDRDNSFLFFDFASKPISGLKLYASVLLDDIHFGKIGTDWYGNKALISAGAKSSLLYEYIPLDISVDYTRIDPYVYSHRIYNNNYTSLGYAIATLEEPNSEIFTIDLLYTVTHRLYCGLIFKYVNHGANPLDENGNLLENVGGNVQIGHRVEDSISTNLLNGVLETKRELTFYTSFEPINNYMFRFNFRYINQNNQSKTNKESIFSSLGLFVKI